MAAAVPFAMKAGSALLGSWLGKKFSGPNAQQQAGMTAAQQGVGALSGAGQSLMRQGGEYGRAGVSALQPAAQYYQNVLGNRAAMSEAMAPEMASVLDYYKGAGSKVSRTMTGGNRDYAQAELDRQKVGQLSLLPGMARRDAARGATDVGGTLLGAAGQAYGAGTSALGNAAYAGNSLFDMGSKMQEQQRQGGNAIGGFIYDILKSTPWGKGKLPTTNIFSGGYPVQLGPRVGTSHGV